MPESNVWETCPTCGALTSNAALHARWHAALEACLPDPPAPDAGSTLTKEN